jgi:hypothetical protein
MEHLLQPQWVPHLAPCLTWALISLKPMAYAVHLGVNKGCVNYTVALLITLKRILRQKKNYGYSNTYFTMQKYKSSKKILLKETKNPSRYYNSIITNLKFQTQAKISSFRNPQIKLDILPWGQNPLSYNIL